MKSSSAIRSPCESKAEVVTSNASGPRIVMMAPAFAPLGNPEAIVNSKLALAFLGAGWQVDVITRHCVTDYAYGREWEPLFEPLKVVTHQPAYRTGNRLRSHAAGVVCGLLAGHPLEGCRWAWHAAQLAGQMHARAPYDLVVTRATPDAAHLAGLLLAQRTGIPWVANWNDPTQGKYPPPYDAGGDARIGRLHERFLSTVARSATWLTFPCARLRRYICDYLGHGAIDRSSVIPHAGADLLSLASGPPGKEFVLCHTGALHPPRDPSAFFRGVADFARGVERDYRVRIRFCGIADQHVTQLAASYGLADSLELLGPQRYADALSSVASSTVAVVIEAPCAEGVFLPSKFVDYVSTGRPLLAVSPRTGTIADILSAHGGGIVAAPDDPEAIRAALATMYELWRQDRLDAEYGSRRLFSMFAPSTITAEYAALFQRLGILARSSR